MDLKIAGIYAITVLARLDEVKAWQSKNNKNIKVIPFSSLRDSAFFA